MEQEMECQHNANCGGYCEDEEQRSMQLCEGCLDAYQEQEADSAELAELRKAMGQLGAAVGRVYVARSSPAAIVVAISERLNGGGRKALAAGRDHLTADGDFQSDKYTWCPAGFLPLKLSDRSARDLLITYSGRRAHVDGDFTRDLLEALQASPSEPGAAGIDAHLFPSTSKGDVHG
jgi:hypothetical protein